MELYQRIKKDLLQARKDRKPVSVDTLRTLLGDIQTLEKQEGEVSETQIIKIIKKHVDGVDISLEYNGDKDKEWPLLQSKQLLESLLPTQISLNDAIYIIEHEFKDSSLPVNPAPPIGDVFKYFKANFEGRYNGKVVKEAYHSIYSDGGGG